MYTSTSTTSTKLIVEKLVGKINTDISTSTQPLLVIVASKVGKTVTLQEKQKPHQPLLDKNTLLVPSRW